MFNPNRTDVAKRSASFAWAAVVHEINGVLSRFGRRAVPDSACRPRTVYRFCGPHSGHERSANWAIIIIIGWRTGSGIFSVVVARSGDGDGGANMLWPTNCFHRACRARSLIWRLRLAHTHTHPATTNIFDCAHAHREAPHSQIICFLLCRIGSRHKPTMCATAPAIISIRPAYAAIARDPSWR